MDAVDEPLERWIAAGGLPAASPIGEGAAMLVLERADHARARAAKTHAIVQDYVMSFEPDVAARRDATGPGFAAAGTFDLLARLAALAPDATATVGDWCPTGHAAAVVVQRLA